VLSYEQSAKNHEDNENEVKENTHVGGQPVEHNLIVRPEGRKGLKDK
jgi:hypothetical protein